MEKGLGELGFWLAVGMVLAAMIVSGALKERAKKREKQATLRALLEKQGGSVTEVLAYLREKDAAEGARDYARRVASGANMSLRQVAGFLGALMVAGLDRDHLEDQMTLIDPRVFTAPWTITRQYSRVKTLNRMVHEDCEGDDRNPIVDGHFTLAPPPPPQLPPPFGPPPG